MMFCNRCGRLKRRYPEDQLLCPHCIYTELCHLCGKDLNYLVLNGAGSATVARFLGQTSIH